MTVRPARADDAAAMAAVHVRSWQETYRGLMPDEVLDDPTFVDRRRLFWESVLEDPRNAEHRAAVAEKDGGLVGIALAGWPAEADDSTGRELWILYVLRAEHGSGAGAGLLDAVLDPAEPATLWVADPNPRAQAFYQRHGFVADGPTKASDGVREIHMARRRATYFQ